jgi:hypothetical protein
MKMLRGNGIDLVLMYADVGEVRSEDCGTNMLPKNV